jgi:hypothetical protein
MICDISSKYTLPQEEVGDTSEKHTKEMKDAIAELVSGKNQSRPLALL